jgi:signal transduction histidine kinase
MRNRRLYVASLEERAATLERELDHLARIAAADERAAIARELHDVVAHSLSVMIIQADGGTYAFDHDPDQARRALTVVAATGREALEDMRRLVAVLRGDGSPTPAAALSPASADPAVSDDRRRITLDQLDVLVERARSAGLTVRFECTGARPDLPPAVELTVYRIVQEALTNVLRHAGPRADVRLCLEYQPEAVHLAVTDDGGDRPVPLAAQDLTGQPIRPGHGLVGMQERASVHGGQFAAGPRAEGGWRVAATVPVPAPGPAAPLPQSPPVPTSLPELSPEPQPATVLAPRGTG